MNYNRTITFIIFLLTITLFLTACSTTNLAGKAINPGQFHPSIEPEDPSLPDPSESLLTYEEIYITYYYLMIKETYSQQEFVEYLQQLVAFQNSISSSSSQPESSESLLSSEEIYQKQAILPGSSQQAITQPEIIIIIPNNIPGIQTLIDRIESLIYLIYYADSAYLLDDYQTALNHYENALLIEPEFTYAKLMVIECNDKLSLSDNNSNNNNNTNTSDTSLPSLVEIIFLEFEESTIYDEATQAKLIVEIENTIQQTQEDILIQITSLRDTLPCEKNHSVNELDSGETFKKYFYIDLLPNLASRTYDFSVIVSNQNSYDKKTLTLTKATTTTSTQTSSTSTNTNTNSQEGFVVTDASLNVSSSAYDASRPESIFGETNAYLFLLLLCFIFVVFAILYLLFIPDKKPKRSSQKTYTQGLVQLKTTTPLPPKKTVSKKSSSSSSSSSSNSKKITSKSSEKSSSKTKKIKLT
jgi:tetratricopeptide (TPR) repeat protein